MAEDDPVEPRWQNSDVLGVINVFERMLLAMEQRLVQKMDDNSRLASERWARHDQELELNTKRVVDRFEKIEGHLETLDKALTAHLKREQDEDLIIQARVRPVKTVFGWLWLHWRDLVLLFIGLIAAGTFFLDWVTHMIDGAPT